MNQEANKKSKKWLWLIIAIVAVLAVVGVVLGIVLSGPSEEGPSGDADNGPKGGRADIYWNIDKEMYTDATTGMSAREPGADGKYRVTFAHDGEQVEYIIPDKRLVNYIDTTDAVSLIFDDSGNVVDAKDVTTIAKEMAKGFYVLKVEGNVITLNGSATLDGLTKQITCTDLTKVMNFSCARENKGELIQPEDVRPLDMVIVYGNDMDEATHFAVMTSPVESAIYWRQTQFYNYGERMTTREPNEDGTYTVPMFCNGELLDLKFRNVEDVNTVDKVTSDICHIGLIFDEDGYVVGTQPSQMGIRGRIACEQFDVTEINGNTFTATKRVGAANLIGNTYTGTLPEGVPVHDASAYFDESQRGKDVGGLQLGDRITVWEDTLGNIVEIYIYIRVVPGPIYYKVDTRGANRQPDENGWYTFEHFAEGSVKTLKTKNELMARFLEQNAFVGLKLKGDVIEDAWGYSRVVAHGYVDYGRYWYKVSSVAGMVVTLTSGDGATMLSKIASPECKVYNLSGIGKYGEETTFQVGDQGVFISDHSGQMVYAVITERTVEGTAVYYNLNRRYDGANQCTARTPDDNGYYVFEMAHNGKQVTIKTKSKAVASKIDKIDNCIIALKPNSKGIVTDAYRGVAATGGRVQCGGQWQYECVLEDGNIQLQRADLPESKYIVKPADGMKVYNVSNVGFNKFRGEADKLEVGDHVLILTDANDKTVIAYIIKQTFKDVTKFCEHCNKKVKFVPWTGTNFSLLEEASGHYYVPANGAGCSTSILGDVPKEKGDKIIIDLNGKTMEFAEGQRNFIIYNEVKMTIIDSVGGGKMINPFFSCGGFGGKMDIYGGTFELPAEHQVITAGGVINISGSHGTTVNFYGGKFISKDPKIEAIAIKNSTVNIHSGFVCDSALTVGAGAEVNMSGTVKISQLKIDKGILLDFTKLGSKSKIGVVARGVFTTHMSASELKAVQKLISCPVKGGSIVVEGDQLACYGTEPDYTKVYEQSIKMDFSNTEKLPTTCPYCDRAAIWEPLPYPDPESKWGNNVVLGGGKHYYLDKNRSIEGVYMLDGGDICLHLNGKTITSTGREIFTIFAGKTLTVMGKGTMKGCGNSAGGHTASVISNNGGLNLCGGTYVATEKGDMPIISNRGDEGNEINVYDGTIKTDGVAIKARMRNVSIHGGTVNGAISTENQKNSTTGKYIGANVVLTGGTVDSIKVVEHGTLEISGTPKVDKLTFGKNVLAKLGELKSGAMIGVDAEGVFTQELASEDAATAALAYFTVAEEGASLRTEGKALYCEPAPFNYKAVIEQANAMTFPTDSSVYTAVCPYCEESVQWTPLSSVVDRYSETNKRYEQFLYDTRHYYADKNITLKNASIQNVTEGAPCVHLNGKTLTGTNGNRVFTTQITILGNGTVTVQNTAGVKAPGEVVHPNGGVMNIFGGTYTTANDVYLSGSEAAIIPFHGGKNGTGAVNFYAGEIKAINSDAVKVWNKGTFNMYGGKITGRPVNVHYAGTAAGAVNIYGGEVEYITVNEGVLDVQGGKIGKITVAAATADGLKLSGAPKIGELKFLVDLKAEVGELTTGAEIGINKVGVFTADFVDEAAAEAAKGFFSAVQDGANIERQGSALACVGGSAPVPDEPAPAPEPEFNKAEAQQIIAAANAMTFPADGSEYEAKCPACGKTVTWVGLKEKTTIDNNGHFYLADDISAEETASGLLYLATWDNGTPSVCLHLNGKNITNTHTGGSGTSGIRVWTAFNLNIMGEGKVTTRSMNFGALDINGGTKVNVYGGTYENDYGNRYTINVKKGDVNIYNADISIGKLRVYDNPGTVVVYDGNYPNVINESANAKVYLLDGDYGTVTLNGVLNVKGGKITKLVAKEGTSLLSISGKPVIDELDLTACNIKLTVGALETGAQIKVKADEGAFTKDFADNAAATAAKAFFTGISGEVKAEGKVLTFTPATTPGGGTEPPTPGPGTNPDPDEPDDPVVLTPAQIIAAANAMTFPTDNSIYNADCPACGERVAWQPITGAGAVHNGTLAAQGHYYLANDITNGEGDVLNFNNYSGQKAYCLHLNGKSIESTAAAGTGIKVWTAQNTLNIMGNGQVKNKAGLWGALHIQAATTVNVYGGTYSCNSSDQDRAIHVTKEGAIVNIYDATILETVTGTPASGKLHTSAGTINVFGGTYPYGYVSADAGVLNIKGGTFNVVNAAAGTVDVTAGTIAKLTQTAATLTVSGTPVINELDMTAATKLLTVGDLATGANIKVKANGVFTADFEDAAAAKAAKAYFEAVEADKGITLDGKALTCIDASLIPPEDLTPAQIIEAAKAMTFPENGDSKTAICPVCGESVSWQPVTAATAGLASGHYYLANDIIGSYEGGILYLNNGSGAEVCLNLNGKTLDNTDGVWPAIRVWSANNKLNVMGNGTVKNNSTNWGALDINPNVEVNVYGGNFFNNTGNRRAIAVKNGTANIYGATIEKGWIYATGGVVNVESGTYEGVWTNNDNATANVNGGTLTKVNHPSDTMAGNLNVNGGTITTMTVKDTAGTTTISGAPVITTLDMSAAGDKKLTVGQLTEGASIGVKAADGVFTTAFADEAAAIAAKAFFTSAVEGRIVAAEGTALVLKEATLMDISQQIVTTANAMTFEAGNIPTTCPKCGENVTWQELNQVNFTEGARTGHWYLSSDITVEDTTRNPALISASGTLCLHLNGHSVSVTSAGFDGRCLNATIGNTLNLYGTGSINGQGPATAMWVAGGTANIYGGDFNAANNYAAIEMRANGTLNFFGGSLSTGQIRHAAANTTVNIYGGSVRTFSASGTGNIATAKTNIYGGTVTTAAAYGSALTVTGGNITTLNSCAPTSTGGITISGNPKITTLTLRSDFLMPTFGAFTEGASIGLGTYTGIISAAYATPAEAQAVADTFPVTPGYGVTVNASKELVYGTKTYAAAEIAELSAKQTFGTAETEAYCYACGQVVTWKPLTGTTSVWDTAGTDNNQGFIQGKHFFVAEDITASTENGVFYFGSWSDAAAYSGTWCLHINGKTVENTAGAVVRQWNGKCSVNVMGNGVLKSGAMNFGAIHANGGLDSNGNSAGINVYFSGDIESNGGNRLAVTAANQAFLNVYSGNIKNTLSANSTGGVAIYGGTVKTLRVAADATSVSVSGNPVIENVDMTNAAIKLTVGTLTTGASIGVTAEGEFTNDIADVNAAKTFFSAVASGKKIDISGQKLTCVDAA